MQHRNRPLVRLLSCLRRGDIRCIFAAVLNRVVPPKARSRDRVLAAANRALCLEIGGPSQVFSSRGLFPVYRVARTVENANFATQTAWESDLRDEGPFVFDPKRPPGRQLLREAGALTGIEDGRYDLVVSSHCLEHLANPLAALAEWHRVTRAGGHLLLLVPDPSRTFDRRRPITTMTHLREDLARCTGEDDLTHFAEILSLHEIRRDPGVASLEEFRSRAQSNFENRCLHHHVFDVDLVRECLTETGWSVLSIERIRPLHLAAFARKAAHGAVDASGGTSTS